MTCPSGSPWLCTPPGDYYQVMSAGYLMAVMNRASEFSYAIAQTAVAIYTQIINFDPNKIPSELNLDYTRLMSAINSTSMISPVTNLSCWTQKIPTPPFSDLINSFSYLKYATWDPWTFPTDATNLTIQTDLQALFCALEYLYPNGSKIQGSARTAALTTIANAVVKLNSDAQSANLTDGYLTAIIAVINQNISADHDQSLVEMCTSPSPKTLTQLDTIVFCQGPSCSESHGLLSWYALYDIIRNGYSLEYDTNICVDSKSCTSISSSYTICDIDY